MPGIFHYHSIFLERNGNLILIGDLLMTSRYLQPEESDGDGEERQDWNVVSEYSDSGS